MTESEGKKSGKKNAGGFQGMGLSEEVYRGIVKMGFRVPTPVQRKSLPVILSGSDTVVMARTGSGKTAAFCIPLLEKLLDSQRRVQQQSATVNFSAGAVILSPTRELSLQTLKVLQTLSTFIEHPSIRCIGINGGESMEKQFALLSSNPDVIVATPGRLAHHLSEIPDFHLRHCDLVVFDEADRLFEMGKCNDRFYRYMEHGWVTNIL
jgi:ATP-dependent RNA helicase DDX54/DBP10